VIKTTEIVLTFDVMVTPENINVVRKLASCDVIEEDPEDIEIGDSIGIDYSLEGEFTEYAIPLAMLFNSSLANKPILKVVRDER